MEALQYIYDEATGIWYKPGFKEIVDGKAFFPTILKQNIERYKKKDKVYTGRKPVQKMTKEKYIKLFELRDQKKSYAYISDELDIAMTTVYNYLNGIRVWKDI
jgi:predicted transcriptional regulator YheO